MLGSNHQLPNILTLLRQELVTVAKEITEQVFLQVPLGVGRVNATKSVQSGQQANAWICSSPVNRIFPQSTADRVWLPGGGMIQQLSNRFHNRGFHPCYRNLNLCTHCPRAGRLGERIYG